MPRNRIAYAQGCTITYNVRIDFGRVPGSGREAPWWRWCSVTIHEMGHIYGRGHSPNPESIMAATDEENELATWWPYFPACE